MCLETRQKRAKRAKEDIIVFKVIKRSGWGLYKNLNLKGKDVKWEPGTHYTELTPFKGMIRNGIYSEITSNAFHSSKTFKEATFNRDNSGHTIKTMIIPKGAKYYEDSLEYASSEIIYPHKDDYRITSLTKEGRPRDKKVKKVTSAVELVG